MARGKRKVRKKEFFFKKGLDKREESVYNILVLARVAESADAHV